MQLQKVSLNPKAFNTCRRKDHSNMSKALEMSIFMMRFPPQALLCKRLVGLEAIHEQSLI